MYKSEFLRYSAFTFVEASGEDIMKNSSVSTPRHKYLKPAPERKPRAKVGPVIAKVLCTFLATVLIIAAGLVGVIYVLEKGPSNSARDLFVRSVQETSAIGFLAEFFLTEEEVMQIKEAGKEQIPAGSTDTSMITVSYTAADKSSGEEGDAEPVEEIEFVPVAGATFKGMLMIVKDPTRVVVASSRFLGIQGQTLERMIEEYDAVGGVNGGGFEDEDGKGTGGIPIGVVVNDGKLLYGANITADTAVIDYNGILHVGNMNGREAMELGARYAVSFGPILIVNGEKCSGLDSGLNPRTAIAQRSDGAILLLVICGRQLESPGATYEDVADVLLAHGAVNALNLDGGSSSSMVYEGEHLIKNSSVVGQRDLPTSILVLK